MPFFAYDPNADTIRRVTDDQAASISATNPKAQPDQTFLVYAPEGIYAGNTALDIGRAWVAPADYGNLGQQIFLHTFYGLHGDFHYVTWHQG